MGGGDAGGVGGGGPILVQPSFCAASYPETLNAGIAAISGPGLDSVTVAPIVRNGALHYEKTLDPSLSFGGVYGVTANGGPDLRAFTAAASIPAPIRITTNLSPGTSIQVPFHIDWTGGDSNSFVDVRLIFPSNDPMGHRSYLSALVSADAGGVTLTPFLTPNPGNRRSRRNRRQHRRCRQSPTALRRCSCSVSSTCR